MSWTNKRPGPHNGFRLVHRPVSVVTAVLRKYMKALLKKISKIPFCFLLTRGN